jgi:hypothetical protein
LFVVRTLSFKLLYGLVILRHARRRMLSIAATTNPTAQWIAGHVTQDRHGYDRAMFEARKLVGNPACAAASIAIAD